MIWIYNLGLIRRNLEKYVGKIRVLNSKKFQSQDSGIFISFFLPKSKRPYT